MKFWKFAITASIILIISMDHVIAKSGKGGGKPGGEDPPPAIVSCADKGSAFPAFAYTKLQQGRKGSSGYDFFLSNADADCAVLIHTSEYKGNDLEFSYSQNGNDGVLIWRQDNNEYAGRKDADKNFDRIKMIRFQTSAKEVTSLPLTSTTVAVTTADHNSFRYIDLSADGNRIAVSVGNNDAGGNTINSIREIDVFGCSSNCAISSALYSHDEFLFLGLSYSSFGDRIYYSSKFRNSSTDVLAGQNYLAFIEKSGISWTSPRYITIEGNGLHGDVGYFRLPDVAITDLGDGPTEVLAFGFSTALVSTLTLQIIDVGTCSAIGSGDCLSSGESSIVETIADGRKPSFDNKFSVNSVFYTEASSNSNIKEYNLMTDNAAVLVSGFQADSGY